MYAVLAFLSAIGLITCELYKRDVGIRYYFTSIGSGVEFCYLV